jgi:hypothetical protein
MYAKENAVFGHFFHPIEHPSKSTKDHSIQKQHLITVMKPQARSTTKETRHTGVIPTRKSNEAKNSARLCNKVHTRK